jgi:type IV secretory pathway VirB4 component
VSALPPALLASARDLAARLEPYFAGGLAYVFGAEDTVDFAAPLVVIHAADGADAEDRLGALKMSLDGAAVREMLESERQAARRYTAVYFDEGQRLLQNPHMRRYVADLFTAIRKRNGMAMLATNSTQALFEREGAVTKAGPIWQNARGKVLLAMSREAADDVRGHGAIPDDVLRLLEGLRPADHLALLQWDGRHEVVRMDVSAEEAALYRTRGLRVAAPDAPSGPS